MTQKICKWIKKDLQKEDPKAFKRIAKNAQFYCRNCGRAAKRSMHLCRAVELKRRQKTEDGIKKKKGGIQFGMPPLLSD